MVKSILNVLTCGLTDSEGVFTKKFKLSSEVGDKDNQASIVEYCLTAVASSLKNGPSSGEVEFAKDTYNVTDTAVFQLQTLDDAEACTELFCEKINKLVTTTDIEDVAGAAEFIDKISDLVVDYIENDDLTVTVISNLLEKR